MAMFLLTGQLAEGGGQNFLIHGKYLSLVRKMLTPVCVRPCLIVFYVTSVTLAASRTTDSDS